MGETSTLALLGLQTGGNELSATQPAALVKAQNVVVTGPGIVGPRRGHLPRAYSTGVAGDSANALAVFEGAPILQATISGAGQLLRDTGSAFVAIGDYDPPDPDTLRMKFLTATRNLYFTTSEGIRALEGLRRAPVFAGINRPMDLASVTVNATVDGWLGPMQSTAYRLTLCRKDAHGRLIESAPSAPFAVTNESTTDSFNTEITFPLPAGLDTTHFFRLYRAPETPGVSATVPAFATPAGDEMNLVFERFLTTEDLSNGAITFTDTTTEGVPSQALYTNQFTGNSAGVGVANSTPPYAKDVCWWDNRAWFINAKQREAILIRILGCGEGQDGATGIRIGDQITFGGWTYTAVDPGSASYLSNTFGLYTSDPDAGVNILNTARSLVNTINYTSNAPSYPEAPVLQATYLSSAANGTFGSILVEATFLNTPSFEASLTTRLNAIAAGQLNRILGVGTITTSTPHGLVDDDTVTIVADDPADLDFAGTFQVNVTNATTFVYNDPRSDGSNSEVMHERRVTPSPAFAWSPAPPPAVFTIAAGGLSRTGSTVTATTDVPHGLVAGQVIPIEAVTVPDAAFDPGTYTVVDVLDDVTFTYTDAGAAGDSTVEYRSGARVTSDPDATPHGAYFSRNVDNGLPVWMPEAVPRANLLTAGIADQELLRGVPLGQNMFLFSTTAIYVASYGSPYTVDLLDDTYWLIAPDSVATCGNAIYCLTNRGVAKVELSGVTLVSGQIEQDLLQYLGSDTIAETKAYVWGASRETDSLYILGLPALGDAEAPYDTARMYVYSLRAGAWVNWEKPWRFATVDRATDTLLFASSSADDAPTIAAERNTKTTADFVDDEFTVIVDGFDSTTKALTLRDAAGVQVGDAIAQGTTTAIVTAIDGDVLTVTAAPFDISIFASGSVDLTATSAGPCGVSIMGHNVTVPYTGDADVDALALWNAIDADATALQYVALNPFAPGGGVVLLANTTNYPGASGNAITLAPLGTGTAVSAATLEGGSNATATIYERIACAVKRRTIVGQSAADWIANRTVHVHFRHRHFRKAELVLTTDQNPNGASLALYPSQLANGTVPDYSPDTSIYVGRPVEPLKMRRQMPNLGDAAYLNVELRVAEAFALWTPNGMTIDGESGSERSQF